MSRVQLKNIYPIKLLKAVEEDYNKGFSFSSIYKKYNFSFYQHDDLALDDEGMFDADRFIRDTKRLNYRTVISRFLTDEKGLIGYMLNDGTIKRPPIRSATAISSYGFMELIMFSPAYGFLKNNIFYDPKIWDADEEGVFSFDLRDYGDVFEKTHVYDYYRIIMDRMGLSNNELKDTLKSLDNRLNSIEEKLERKKLGAISSETSSTSTE